MPWTQQEWDKWKAQWWQRDGWQQAWWRDHDRVGWPAEWTSERAAASAPEEEPNPWLAISNLREAPHAQGTAASAPEEKQDEPDEALAQWQGIYKYLAGEDDEAAAESAPEPNPWQVMRQVLAETAPPEFWMELHSAEAPHSAESLEYATEDTLSWDLSADTASQTEVSAESAREEKLSPEASAESAPFFGILSE